jgi:hypothetical protein
VRLGDDLNTVVIRRLQMQNPVPLGDVIAERCFTLKDSLGEPRQITVRLGRPVSSTSPGLPHFRCPLQVIGIGRDEAIAAPAGEDAFMALQWAMNLAGDFIDGAVQREGLVNHHRNDLDEKSWIWRYASED